jgi:UDP-N-acetylglucosamine:LPS N-acetylglucosamine transferase
LAHAPALYGGAMRLWARAPRLAEMVSALSARRFDRALDGAVQRVRPDLVVTTYNLAAQALDRLARRGRLSAPVVVYVTDPGPHPYWVSRSAALHMAFTAPTAEGLGRAGARHVEVVRPVLRSDAGSAPVRQSARARLGLPSDDRLIALVNGGSWAAGRLAETVAQLLQDDDVMPVVLCGRDPRLATLVRSLPRAVAVPWTEDVLLYLAAADVVVDNAGGQTCLEALACGTPVVVFRPLPGHGRLNAQALADAGLATFARRPDELLPAVRRPVAAALPAQGRDPAEAVLAVLAACAAGAP